ncbi:TerC/Alx family metal homeostasis membrane protein [Thiolapillus sp.]|uniref:TerC/Alx family metal homeostasis membrane protein n=13 Tax=Thiolapillus sp. TaxID=2017437 RepID=UPI002738C939|nr:TerC/Alx family metal homeostasis membrane protein [Thiolapillus sp.]
MEINMPDLGFHTEGLLIMMAVLGLSVWADLRIHKNKAEISFRDALLGTLFWIALAIGFFFYIEWRHGPDYASLYMAGYALEKSLSVDNMMVFVAIFSAFGIRDQVLQHRILYYGIIGAILFRAVFIGLGTTLFGVSAWVELLFAAVVLWSAWAIVKGGDDEEIEDYSNHWSVRLAKHAIPIFPRLLGKKLLISKQDADRAAEGEQNLIYSRRAKWLATPAFLCLVCIEVSDIVFSFDSVPAIIAVTREPFLVYAASIFAIVGLRSLYFLLAVAAKYLCHLEKAVAFVLVFVAFKLAVSGVEHISGIEFVDITSQQSMWIVLSTLVVGVVTSVIFPEKGAAG